MKTIVTLDFGQKFSPWHRQYPNPFEQKWSGLFHENTRLSKIKYLADWQGRLAALALMFSNGAWTGAFTTPNLHGLKLRQMTEVEIPGAKPVR